MFEAKKRGVKSRRPPMEELSAYYAEHTAKEVAAHYGVAVDTVKMWIRDYRKQLKAAQEQKETV